MRGNLLWNLVGICSKILSGNAYKVKDFYSMVTREKWTGVTGQVNSKYLRLALV